jgi:hypothetical protein
LDLLLVRRAEDLRVRESSSDWRAFFVAGLTATFFGAEIFAWLLAGFGWVFAATAFLFFGFAFTDFALLAGGICMAADWEFMAVAGA